MPRVSLNFQQGNDGGDFLTAAEWVGLVLARNVAPNGFVDESRYDGLGRSKESSEAMDG
jgi:hypothetical protein